MAALPVATVAAGSLAAAVLFGGLAWHWSRRRIEPEVRIPASAFAVAWIAYALQAWNDAARVLVGELGLSPELYFTLARLKILTAATAIWGFGVYVSYLWSGRFRRWAIGLGLFSIFHALLFLYLLERRHPLGLERGTWGSKMIFENPPVLADGLAVVPFVFFFVPPIVLAVIYLALVRRLDDPTTRYRVGLVALAILVFHATNLYQSNPETSPDAPFWPVIVALNVCAGVIAYGAYRPPGWVRRWLHVEALGAAKPRPMLDPGTPTGPGSPRR